MTKFERARKLDAKIIFALLAICLLLISPGALAESTAKILVSVEGYDGRSTMNVSLVDPTLRYLMNKTVSSGEFVLEGVSINQTYYILLQYKGVNYVQTVSVRSPLEKVKFTVFDTTTSDEWIVIDFHHIVIEREKDALKISEFLQYRNVGSKVYNGTEIKISMPEGYYNLASEHSCCMRPTDYGLAFTPPSPIKPNSTQYLELSYYISPKESPFTFSKKNFYNTASLVVLVSTDLQTDSFTNLEKGDYVNVGNKRYASFFLSNAPNGSEIELTISGVGQAASQWLWMSVILTVALIIGLSAYGIRGSRRLAEDLTAKKRALEEVLAELERDYRAGKLEEIQYLKLRLRYLEKLKKLERKLGEISRKGGR